MYILIVCFGEENVTKIIIFRKRGILPQPLGRWFSRPIKATPQNNISLPEKFCYCQEGEKDKIVACDNESCSYKWLHYEYINITSPSKTKKWFCLYEFGHWQFVVSAHIYSSKCGLPLVNARIFMLAQYNPTDF